MRGQKLIVQFAAPKFRTKYYDEAIAKGEVVIDYDVKVFTIKDLKCPNCGIHIGDKVVGADFFQPFICPKCKGIFVFDL